jgi:hypothetical protein
MAIPIKCPHCRNWSVYEQSAAELCVSGAEQPVVLEALARGESHPKLLQCQHQERDCIGPFDAFLCATRELAEDALRFMETAVPNRWSRTVVFRPRCEPRDDATPRDEFAVLCFSRPIRRDAEIRLTEFVDGRLLPKVLAGFQVVLPGPSTLFERGGEHGVRRMATHSAFRAFDV